MFWNPYGKYIEQKIKPPENITLQLSNSYTLIQ